MRYEFERDGTVVASVPAGAAFDAASNANVASTSTDHSVTFDNAPPAVTINQAATQSDPTAVSPVFFTVTFSEPVTGFTSTDVSLILAIYGSSETYASAYRSVMPAMKSTATSGSSPRSSRARSRCPSAARARCRCSRCA